MDGFKRPARPSEPQSPVVEPPRHTMPIVQQPVAPSVVPSVPPNTQHDERSVPVPVPASASKPRKKWLIVLTAVLVCVIVAIAGAYWWGARG